MTSVILLTGQYGTSHEVVARSLCTLIQEHQPQSTAAYYSVEDEIWDILPADSFFELQTDRERDTYWHRAFSRVKRKIDDAAPRFAFVSVHAVYLWKKRFFSCLDWDRLLTIPVRVILTLIDEEPMAASMLRGYLRVLRGSSCIPLFPMKIDGRIKRFLATSA